MNSKFLKQQGFSLLEILVAFSILALSLGVLLNIFSGGLRRAIISEEYQQAVTIAQSKMALAGVEEELQEGNIQGTVAEKFFWNTQIELFDFDELGLVADDVNVFPFKVTVVVEWLAGENNRQVELTTLKLSSTR